MRVAFTMFQQVCRQNFPDSAYFAHLSSFSSRSSPHTLKARFYPGDYSPVLAVDEPLYLAICIRMQTTRPSVARPTDKTQFSLKFGYYCGLKDENCHTFFISAVFVV